VITPLESAKALPVTYFIDRRGRIAATYEVSWTTPGSKRISKCFWPST